MVIKTTGFYLVLLLFVNSTCMNLLNGTKSVMLQFASKNLSGKQLIRFSASDMRIKMLKEDEFIIEDHFFDIVKTEKIDGQIFYFAYCDTMEEGFADQLANSDVNHETNIPEPKLSSLVLKIFSLPAAIRISPVFNGLKISNEFYNEIYYYSNPPIACIAHPPEIS